MITMNDFFFLSDSHTTIENLLLAHFESIILLKTVADVWQM